MLKNLKKDLKKLANKKRAEQYLGFFKTRKGEYGEGDKFVGITVPQQRQVAKKYLDISLEDLAKLVSSPIHEYRLTGFILLVYKYARISNWTKKKKYYNFYIKNRRFVNNWDLVDTTAPKIVGDFLFYNPKQKNILYKYAMSKKLWERRIAILATYTFIKNNNFQDTLKLAEVLLKDKHDLMHKAVGWMLREVGKRDLRVEEDFLKKYYKKMPRTMLRYAIEKFPEDKRKQYLKNEI